MRPELVLKAGIAAWGASGDGNATTMLAEPVRVRRQIGAHGAAAGAALARLPGPRGDGRASCRRTRPRAAVEGCRELTAPPTWCATPAAATSRVDPRTHEVTLDGEPVDAPPLDEVALSSRYLLG